MSHYHVDEIVRLIRTLPDLPLEHGAEGVVQKIWSAPATAYEVEFRPSDTEWPVRALLLPEQLMAAA